MCKFLKILFCHAKPLVIDQQILTWLRVLPAKENTTKWENCASIALVSTLIVVTLTILSISLMYIVEFISVDVLESLFGIYQTIGTIPMANTIIVAFLLRHKIPPVFEQLSDFYEKRMNT